VYALSKAYKYVLDKDIIITCGILQALTNLFTKYNGILQAICIFANWVYLILGFRRDVDVICGLLGDYTASCGNYLPKFRDNVSVPSSRVEIPRRKESH
jgi:hypothetical protein